MHRPIRRSLGCCAILLTLAACGPGASHAGKVPDIATTRATELDMRPPPGREGRRLRRAMDDMDQGQIEAAIATLTKLHDEFPRNGIVLHELGLAYRLHREPKRAVSLLMPHRDAMPADLVAGLGSALDEAGDTEAATVQLRDGIKKFPESGLLHSELGTLLATHGKPTEAIVEYERGIAAEPSCAPNYYNAAHLLADTSRRGMAIIYAEIFRLLEPDSRRSRRTAELLVKQCYEAVKLTQQGDKTNARIALAPDGIDTGKTTPAALAVEPAFEVTFGVSLVAAHMRGFSLATLHGARSAFVEQLRGPDAPRSLLVHPLTRWLVALDNAGHLEAYDVWLYGSGFPDEASAWLNRSESKPRLSAMAKYIVQHPLFPLAAKENPDTI